MINYHTVEININTIYKLSKEGKIKFLNKNNWTEINKTNFIKSILINSPIDPIHIVRHNEGIHILDGKERISTILEFLDNKLILNSDILPEYNNLDYSDLNSYIKGDFLLNNIRCLEYSSSSIPMLFELGKFK